MNQPTQCHLWQKENLTDEDLNFKNNFELLHTFVDSSHLERYLLKCKDCGQLYFYEFYEEIDWEKGNDPQYCTLFPIENKEEAEKMAKMSPLELLQFSPRLQKDLPAKASQSTIHWIGKHQAVNKKQETNIVEKAARISVLAHEGNTRKADGLPYVIHPFMVALKLAKYNFSDEIIAAALVHDVLEETDYPPEQLKTELGEKVFEIVKAVTNDKSLPWEEKKMKYIETVRNGPEGAKAIVVADKIHNLESLLIAHAEQGPDIWKKFNRGKEKKAWFEKKVLKMLKETWQHPLIDEYERLLEQEKNLE